MCVQTQALVVQNVEQLFAAQYALIDVGFFEHDPEDHQEPGHYITDPVRCEDGEFPGIRSASDDREVLGDIAKQLVIAGVAFRVVTAR